MKRLVFHPLLLPALLNTTPAGQPLDPNEPIKTQTRRTCPDQPVRLDDGQWAVHYSDDSCGALGIYNTKHEMLDAYKPVQLKKCPLSVGDIVAVAETHAIDNYTGNTVCIMYKVDGSTRIINVSDAAIQKVKARKYPLATLSGRYMLAEFSRMHLKITGIEVQILGDIPEEDALQEGISVDVLPDELRHGKELPSPVATFGHLWNKVGGNWEARHQTGVYRITFERVDHA